MADIPIPGDAVRFDYRSLDPTTGRLDAAHMDAGQLVLIGGGAVVALPSVTGGLAVPEPHRVYAAVAGEYQVAAIDADSC